jgi:phytanoyl-CoA hydroxylase
VSGLPNSETQVNVHPLQNEITNPAQYALEDATASNGCLSFLPGSHKNSPICKRFVRKENNSGTEFIDNAGAQFPAGDKYSTDGERKGEYKLGEVKAGTLVLIHGNLLHKSEKNTSEKGRIIYTFHVIEGDEAIYDERNWLQPPEEGFTKL